MCTFWVSGHISFVYDMHAHLPKLYAYHTHPICMHSAMHAYHIHMIYMHTFLECTHIMFVWCAYILGKCIHIQYAYSGFPMHIICMWYASTSMCMHIITMHTSPITYISNIDVPSNKWATLLGPVTRLVYHMFTTLSVVTWLDCDGTSMHIVCIHMLAVSYISYV